MGNRRATALRPPAGLPPGTWWECDVHGWTERAVTLEDGRVAYRYCAEDGCTLQLTQLQGAGRDLAKQGKKGWNTMLPARRKW